MFVALENLWSPFAHKCELYIALRKKKLVLQYFKTSTYHVKIDVINVMSLGCLPVERTLPSLWNKGASDEEIN